MPGDLTIALAAAYDLRAIAEMSRDEIEEGLPWRWTTTRLMHSLGRRDTNIAVARSGQDLVGFGIMRYDDLAAHLILFAVHRLHRRKEIGTALLKWLEDVALTAGIERIRAEMRADNESARAFYRKHGYKEAETILGMYHGCEDGVRLQKVLSQPPKKL
jgi:[ribosomal protein S18]-alanine N-acetyltransferase